MINEAGIEREASVVVVGAVGAAGGAGMAAVETAAETDTKEAPKTPTRNPQSLMYHLPRLKMKMKYSAARLAPVLISISLITLLLR